MIVDRLFRLVGFGRENPINHFMQTGDSGKVTMLYNGFHYDC